jgi:hypothetical protein
MKRLMYPLVLAGVFLALALGVAQARADSPKATLVTVTCDSGPFPSFETPLPPLGQAVAVIGSTSNFITVSLTYTEPGGTTTFVAHSSNADPKGQALVTCHSVGPVSGNLYTFVGFFTPARPLAAPPYEPSRRPDSNRGPLHYE